MRRDILIIALLATCAFAQYPFGGDCIDCAPRRDMTRTEGTGQFHLGMTASGIVGTGPFGIDVVGSINLESQRNIYSIINFREEQDYLWGFEVGGFLRLPDGERIEITITYAKTSAGLIASYIEPQTEDSLITYRHDSMHVAITEITPKLRFSAALPYGLEPFIGVGLAADFLEVSESYNIEGTFGDSLGGEIAETFVNESKISVSGLELLIGTKVRITDNLAFHFDVSGVFLPYKNLSLGDINNVVTPVDQWGNPREEVTILVMPREHRIRLTHATARFGVEVSFDMLGL